MTSVFDYGPFDNQEKGFQVVYSSRFSNSAGGTKELYYLNAGMLNLDANEIIPEGGLRECEAAAMGLKPNLLEKFTLPSVTNYPLLEAAGYQYVDANVSYLMPDKSDAEFQQHLDEIR